MKDLESDLGDTPSRVLRSASASLIYDVLQPFYYVRTQAHILRYPGTRLQMMKNNSLNKKYLTFGYIKLKLFKRHVHIINDRFVSVRIDCHSKLTTKLQNNTEVSCR